MKSSKFKAAVKNLNNAFVSFILVVFYFSVIGISFLIYRLSILLSSKKQTNSYWIDEVGKEIDIENFYSQY